MGMHTGWFSTPIPSLGRTVPRAGATLLSLLLVSPHVVLWGIPQVDQAGEPLVCDLTGHIASYYGYSFTLPRDLKACAGWPRSYLIPLAGPKDDRYVICGAERSLDADTAAGMQSEDRTSSVLADPSYATIRLVKRFKLSLGNVPAERIVYRYREHAGQVEMMRDEVYATNGTYDFYLYLVTSVGRYDTDRRTFEEILSGWSAKHGS